MVDVVTGALLLIFHKLLLIAVLLVSLPISLRTHTSIPVRKTLHWFPIKRCCVLRLCYWSKSSHKAVTVNFQNNTQVQINAWFKLTPGTKHTVYNL